MEWIKELPDVPMGKLPPHLDLQRTRVLCNPDAPIHVCIYFLPCLSFLSNSVRSSSSYRPTVSENNRVLVSNNDNNKKVNPC